ncbi:MAG: hypothetical protein N3A01_08720 [Bacteroidales bacterium]|nr:hypothetical protein [Bacteroidales bacterium]
MNKKILCFVFILFAINVFSQCKNFTKKFCVSQIKPYTYNGQLNMAVLNKGDVAELFLTFYQGQDYRIFVCAQDILGNVEFRLLDSQRNLIFTNKDHDYIKYWDFHANATQQLIVQVIIPPSTTNEPINPSGCVSILVGFKE